MTSQILNSFTNIGSDLGQAQKGDSVKYCMHVWYFRYVCLKERNMLMTMEEEYTRECLLFPNPERIFKVFYWTVNPLLLGPSHQKGHPSFHARFHILRHSIKY